MLNLIIGAVCVLIGGFGFLFCYERGYNTGQMKAVKPIKLPTVKLPHTGKSEEKILTDYEKMMLYTGDLPKEGDMSADDNAEG